MEAKCVCAIFRSFLCMIWSCTVPQSVEEKKKKNNTNTTIRRQDRLVHLAFFRFACCCVFFFLCFAENVLFVWWVFYFWHCQKRMAKGKKQIHLERVWTDLARACSAVRRPKVFRHTKTFFFHDLFIFASFLFSLLFSLRFCFVLYLSSHDLYA